MDTVGEDLKVLALYQDKREQGKRQYLELTKDEHLVRLAHWFRGPKRSD